jgi:hypothetical protein
MNKDAKRTKEPVTVRLDARAKSDLHAIAQRENRTFSSLIDLAVRDFLDRRQCRARVDRSLESLKICHAHVPDSIVLRAFATFSPAEFSALIENLGLPQAEFVDKQPEWRKNHLHAGSSDLVETFNWLPIFWHIKRGGSSPRIGWIGPYLQIFSAHCIFIRREFFKEFMTEEGYADFLAFEGKGKTAREKSLRSITAWLQQSPDRHIIDRSLQVLKCWTNTVITCQMGTDLQIAVQRVTPLLHLLANKPEDYAYSEPTLQGNNDLHAGFQCFMSSAVTGFTGHALQSTELLTDGASDAVLLAGPADVRVPSLNTIAGHQSLFGTPGCTDSSKNVFLAIWTHAVHWFRNNMLNEPTGERFHTFMCTHYPEYIRPETTVEDTEHNRSKVLFLRSFMQTWIQWFADPQETQAFMGNALIDGLGSHTAPTPEDLVQHYETLCDALHPAGKMPPAIDANPMEHALWKFPTLS